MYMKSIARIYVLVDPRDGDVRYVGWTKQELKTRLRRHMYDGKRNKNNHRSRWLGSLLREGLVPVIREIQTVPLSDYIQAERYWIAWFRANGCRLTNGTDGGDGKLGAVVSPVTRARISAAFKDKPLLPATRIKIGVSNKAAWAKPEAQDRRKGTWTGRRHTEQSKARISAAKRGSTQTNEHRAKIGAAAVLAWQDPVYRARMSLRKPAHLRGSKLSQTHRDALRAAQTPEVRARAWVTRRANLKRKETK